MTYTQDNLPKAFLKAPVNPTHPFAIENWNRNWSLYFISRQWVGREWGMYEVLAKWANTVQPTRPRITRQRVQSIIQAMSWRLRDCSDTELGIDPASDREKIER